MTKEQSAALSKSLYYAVVQGTAQAVAAILEVRAEPSRIACLGGQSLVHLAAARLHGAREVCELLVGRNQDPGKVDTLLGQTPLFFAVRPHEQSGGLDCARFLLAARCDPNVEDLRGEPALMYAAQRPDPGCAREMLVAKADISHASNDGDTALFWAVRAGAVPCVRLLISAEADVNARCKKGTTALFETVSAPTGEDVMEELLLHHCDPRLCTDEGVTALMVAAGRGAPSGTVRALLVGRSDVYATDFAGNTALLYAAMKGHKKASQLLVDEGRADIHYCNRDGASALTFLPHLAASPPPPTAPHHPPPQLAPVPLPAAPAVQAAAPPVAAAAAPAPVHGALDGALDGGEASPAAHSSDGKEQDGQPLKKVRRQLYQVSFQDQDGRSIAFGTEAYRAALESFVAMCPWHGGWELSDME